MAQRGHRSHLGPIDPSVLNMQDSHVSEKIWNKEKDRVLNVRQAHHFHHRAPPAAIHDHLRAAGFMGLAQTDYMSMDHCLITALVERWRPETHTFHLPPGETTITLQDVGVLLGLPIEGQAVASPSVHSWIVLVRELLGIPLPNDKKIIKGGRLNMKWLEKQFGELEDGANSLRVRRYARQYILRLIGAYYFRIVPVRLYT